MADEELPTKERLARDLTKEGLPAAMIKRAREGWYDEWEGPLATPMMQLRQDLLDHGRPDLAADVERGRWEGTQAESDAWARSPEGREAFAELAGSDGQIDDEALARKVKEAAEIFHEEAVAAAEDNDEPLPVRNTEQMMAAIDVIKRAGGQELLAGRHGSGKFAAQARFLLADGTTQLARVEDFSEPEMAVEALARRVIDGGTCNGCGKTVRMGGPRKDRHKICRWRRIGPAWRAGCQ